MNSPRNQPCPLNEQAVGWALHALEPDEEIAVLLHVPQCPSCQAAAREAEEVLAQLGASVEQVDLPARLRGSILSAAADTPQRPIQPGPRAAVPAPRHRVVADEPVGSSTRPRNGSSWVTRRRLVAASVALVGVLAVGGLAVRTTQLEQQSETLTAQSQSIADLVGQLDRPGVQHAMLTNTAGATTAAVVVVDGKRQVYAVGLPANAKDHSYVLWGLNAGAPATALGAFSVASDKGMTAVGNVSGKDGYSDYAVSYEAGSTPPPAPTMVVAKGQIES